MFTSDRIKQKIKELHSLGIRIYIRNKMDGVTLLSYDEMIIYSEDECDEVEKKLDEKIKFLEDKSWLSFIKKLYL